MSGRGDRGGHWPENWRGSLYCFYEDMKTKLQNNVGEKGEPTKDQLMNCPQEHLVKKLKEHLEAGNFDDVANFAFLMYQRKEGLAIYGNKQMESQK